MTQNNKPKSGKKLFSSRKLKYGTSAVVFTAVFVAFIILANVLVSFIDARNGGLYVDLTTKNLYGISDATKREMQKTDKPVEIIFCQPADKFDEYDELNRIKLLAENYEKEFKNVTVIYKDRLSEPAYFDQFKKSSTDMINTYSVIINCPVTGRSMIYDWENFYKKNTDGELFAFDGEYKFTSAILSVARTEENMLKAGMVTGHNELSNHQVRHYLEDYGYDVSNVDLKTISQEELATYSLLLVCDPVSDFIGMSDDEIGTSSPIIRVPENDVNNQQADSDNAVIEATEDTPVVTTPSVNASSQKVEAVNETAKLLNYVVNDLGNIMFFIDPNANKQNNVDLPELFSLISDGFGVEIDNSGYVADITTALSSNRFYGSYSLDTASAGYALHKPVSEAGAGLPPAFGISCSLNIPKENDDGFNITPVICGSEGTMRVVSKGYEAAPNAPLITLSKYIKIVDNKEVSGNVIVCGSVGFLEELDNPSFANADLFKQMLVSIGNDKIIVDIDFKVLDETSIDVTNAMIDDMMKRLVIIVPVIIVVVGIAVFIKRKYL